MPTTLKQPTDRRGHPGGPTPEDRDERRSRVAMYVLALPYVLFFVSALASAVGVFPFGAEEAAERESAGRLPPGWASLEPLMPLAPSLKDVAYMKRDAAGGPSRVLRARGSGRGAIRLRARPTGGTLSRVDPAPTRAVSRAPRVRPRLGALPPIALERVLDRYSLPRRLPAADLDPNLDLDGLPNLPGRGGGIEPFPDGLQIPDPLPDGINIPPIDPFPGGTGPLPGGGVPLPDLGLDPLRGGLPAGTGRLPLGVTVLDSGADPHFDVLLASSGGRVRERYVFRDRDISALAAQVNVRSRLLVADVLSDGTPLEHVARASLEPSSVDGAGRESASRADRAGKRKRGGGGDPSARDDARRAGAAASNGGDLGGYSRGAERGGGRASAGGRRGGGRGSSAGRARSRRSGSPADPRSGGRSSAPGRSRGRGGDPPGRARRGPPRHSSRGKSRRANRGPRASGGSRGRGREPSSPRSRNHRGDG